jgi:hypothetical protein
LSYGESLYEGQGFHDTREVIMKVTVNLPEETVEAIKKIASDRGTTITEAIRQAIESQYFLHEEVQNGRQVLLQNPSNKTVQRLVFFPSAVVKK